MTEELVEAWFQKWFHNSPGFSDNVLIFNRLQEAKIDLKNLLNPPLDTQADQEKGE